MAKNQITRLKNLILNSVDLCRIGANQKAHICLTKSLDNRKENDELQIFKNIALSISKALGINESEENISKMTNAITETLMQNEEQKIKKSMYDSLGSIINDSTTDEKQKAEILEKSVSEFFTAVYDFVNESKNENGNLNKSIGDDESMIDVNKMTPEDKTAYESLIKKYSSDDEQDNKSEDNTQVNKTNENEQSQAQKSVNNQGSELSPEVKKAIDELESTKAEVEKLKKSLELKELETFVKKYEILGKNSEELTAKLYKLKKSSDTDYNDYIALLDEQVEMIKSLGLFSEIGTSRMGETNVNKQLEQKIQDIMKSDTSITYEQAFVKACDENDELKKSII